MASLGSTFRVAIQGKAGVPFCGAHVCFWPLADIASRTAHVDFLWLSMRFGSEAKADIAYCGAYVWLLLLELLRELLPCLKR